MMNEQARYRIGEVGRRTGVAVATLRAWERRYGVLDPVRTDGGHRLYSETDIARVRRVQELVEEGWSVSSAAAAVREGSVAVQGATQDPSASPPASPDQFWPAKPLLGVPGAPLLDEAVGSSPPGGAPTAARLAGQLRDAVDAFDAALAERILDDTLGLLDIAAALDRVFLPVVRWAAQGWRDDPRVIAREHFASDLLHTRLRRTLGAGFPGAPSCIAAAPEDDEHDLGLLAAASVLAAMGIRVHYLGPRTPVPALEQAVNQLGPEIVLIGSVFRTAAERWLATKPRLGDALVVMGGAGFIADDAHAFDHAIVDNGPLTELPGLVRSAMTANAAR